jgi:hypothetical protein
MGRRDVASLVALAAVLAVCAPAVAAGLTWHEISHGPGGGIQLISPVVFLASSEAEAKTFAISLPPNANNALAQVNYKKNLVVAVFAGNGCRQHRFSVTSLAQHGTEVLVKLATKPMPKGTDCLVLSPTYRLLVVPRLQLVRPYPTSADYLVASA